MCRLSGNSGILNFLDS